MPALDSQTRAANFEDEPVLADSQTGKSATGEAKDASQSVNTTQSLSTRQPQNAGQADLQPAVVAAAVGPLIPNGEATDATPINPNGELRILTLRDSNIHPAPEGRATLLGNSNLATNSGESPSPASGENGQTWLGLGDRLGATQPVGGPQGKDKNFDARLGGPLIAKNGIGSSPEAASRLTQLEQIGQQLSASEPSLANQPNQEKDPLGLAIVEVASTPSLPRMDTLPPSGLPGIQDYTSLAANGAVALPLSPKLGAAAQFGLLEQPASSLDTAGQANAMATDANSFGGSSAMSFHLDLQFDPQSPHSGQDTTGGLSLTGDPSGQAPTGDGSSSGPSDGQDHGSGQDGLAGSGYSKATVGLPANRSEFEGSLESAAATSIELHSPNEKNGGLPTPLSDANRPNQSNERSAGSPIQEQLGGPGLPQSEQPAPSTASGLQFQGNEAPKSSLAQLNSNPSTLGTSRPNGEAAPRPLAAAVHQLRIEIPVPSASGGVDEKIQLHFNQRNAGLNLGIHANNGDLGLELRDALPELIRKLGTGGWQPEHSPGASASSGSETLPQDPRSDFGRSLRLSDRNTILMDEAAASAGQSSQHRSMSESSDGRNKASSEANISQDPAEAGSPRQRGGQQDNSPGRDTNDSDAQQRDPRRERRGRQQNWNRAWSGLNLNMPANE